ncbi:MAG: SDR family oxidoreductase [Actinomadura sp.]
MSVALITGALGGIGRAIARRLAAAGHIVALSDLPRGELTALAAELGGIAAPADVSDPQAVEAMVGDVRKRTGEHTGILVAGAAHLTMAPFAEHDLDDWWRVVDVSLGGTFACVQAVLPGMVERGGGRMVLLSSEWGLTGWPGATAYSAAKAGVIALTKSLGRELGPLGIAVNAVAPGPVDSALLEVNAAAAGISAEEARARHADRTPLGRIATSEEIAEAVAFLADDRLPTLLGQVLHVNGGSIRARA